MLIAAMHIITLLTKCFEIAGYAGSWNQRGTSPGVDYANCDAVIVLPASVRCRIFLIPEEGKSVDIIA